MHVYPLRMVRGESNSLGQQVNVLDNVLARASYAHLGQESWRAILDTAVLSLGLLFLTDEDRMKALEATEGPSLSFEHDQCKALFGLLAGHTRPLSVRDSRMVRRGYSTALRACSAVKGKDLLPSCLRA